MARVGLLVMGLSLVMAQSPPPGVVTTIAGTDFPLPVAPVPAVTAVLPPLDWGKPAVDAGGNVYFALTRRNAVLRWSPGGRIQLAAGTGIAGFSGDGGPAATASLNAPADVAIDSRGALYIADTGNRRIRRVNPDGRIETVAGGGATRPGEQGIAARSAALQALGPLAVDPSGAVYFNIDSGSLARLDPASALVRLIAGTPGRQGAFTASGSALQTQFRQITGLAADANGSLWIADSGSSAIGRLSGGRVDLAVTRSAIAGAPLDLAVDPSGTLFFTVGNSGVIYRVAAGSVVERAAGDPDFEGSSPSNTARDRARFGAALRLIASTRDTLIVSDSRNGRLRRVTSVVDNIAGAPIGYTGESGPATAASFPAPSYLAQGPDGAVYFSDSALRVIFSVDTRGLLRRFAGTGELGEPFVEGRVALETSFTGPAGLAFDSSGVLYVADGDCAIKTISPGGVVRVFAGLPNHCGTSADGARAADARFGRLRGLAFDASNMLYATDVTNHKVWRIAPTGVVTGFAGSGANGFNTVPLPAAQAPLNAPATVHAANGAIYIADSGNHRIARVLDGRLSTFAGIGQQGSSGDGGPANLAALNSPAGLASDAAGNLYVAETGANRVRRISPSGTISAFAGSGIRGLRGDGLSALNAQFNSPQGLAFAANGRLLIADRDNGRIRAVLPSPPPVRFAIEPIVLTGGPAPRQGSIALSAPVPGMPFETSVRYSGAATGWLRVAPGRGVLPSRINYEVNIAGLREGIYSANLVITIPNATPRETLVPVTVRVPAPPANPFSILSGRIVLNGPRGASAQAALPVSNGSAEPAIFRASIASRTPGLFTVFPAELTVPPGGEAAFSVAADAGQSPVATYPATVTVATPAGQRQVPVTFTVTSGRARLALARGGFAFRASAGSPAARDQSLFISGSGIEWTARAATASGGGWLRVSPSNGTVPEGQSARINIGVNIDGLNPGEYYGRVEVGETSNPSSRRIATVLLEVLAPGSDTGTIATPSVYVFTTTEGEPPPAQEMQLILGANRTASWTASASTTDDPAWLGVYPNGGSASGSASGRVFLQPDVTSLAPGNYRGSVTVAFDDGESRTVPVILIVNPSAQPKSSVRAASGCQGPNLTALWASPAPGFRASIGEPLRIAVRAVDQCGNPHVPENGASSGVAVTGAGSSPLNLIHTGGGVWEATWVPQQTTASLTLTSVALYARGTFLALGGDRVSGSIGPSTRPVVFDNSLTDAATFQFGAPLGPGTLVSLFGANLNGSSAVASTLPLPRRLGDVEVRVNGAAVPLLFAGPDQVNAQIPFELEPDSEFQIELVRDTALAAPQSVVVSQARPGVFSVDQSGAGQGHIYIARPGGQQVLAGAADPAAAGDVIVVYSNGLGRTNPLVAAGEPTPFTALSPTANPVTLTVDGREAAVQFSGLVPGFVGLFQINATVPPGIAPSNAAPVVITVAGQQSVAATMAVR